MNLEERKGKEKYSIIATHFYIYKRIYPSVYIDIDIIHIMHLMTVCIFK